MSGEVYTGGQFSRASVVKPFPGFVQKYQGLVVNNNPIAMPGILDPRAGKPGYDPNLIAGVPVPMGSRVLLWLPRFGPIAYGTGGEPTYEYRLCWRIRSLEEQTGDDTDTLSGHLGEQLPGIPQAPGAGGIGSPGLRYVIPTAFETVQVPDSTQAEPRVINVDTALYTLSSPEAYSAPISENYNGAKSQHAAMLSQGFFSNGNGAPVPSDDNAGFSGGPQYGIVETTARGDELIILITRPAGDNANWSFTDVDLGLAQMLGASEKNIGAYVFTGTVAG